MYLIDNRKIEDSTLILIGVDLGILPMYSQITEENVNKVKNAIQFSININMPMHTVDSRTAKGRFELQIGNYKERV